MIYLFSHSLCEQREAKSNEKISFFIFTGLPYDLSLYWHQYPYNLGLTFCKMRALISEAWVLRRPISRKTLLISSHLPDPLTSRFSPSSRSRWRDFSPFVILFISIRCRACSEPFESLELFGSWVSWVLCLLLFLQKSIISSIRRVSLFERR